MADGLIGGQPIIRHDARTLHAWWRQRRIHDHAFRQGQHPLTQLIWLNDYGAPSMPPDDAVRKAWNRVRKKLTGLSDEPVLKQDGLERMSLKGLDDVANPAANLLQDALDDRLRGWLTNPEPESWLQVLVLPPCEYFGVVESWASSAGHQLLPAPARDQLMIAGPVDLPDLGGTGLLVIPRLEHWFIRQRNGLQLIRQLLAQLAASRRHCVVVCNSWAWRFLVKAAGADALLPRPRTLDATDAVRLRQQFAEHAVDDAGRPLTFRLASNGEDVLACNDDGEPKSGYLQQLAARSLGIPWVARQLWRASLSVRTAAADLPERAVRATADDARTVWVADAAISRLPRGHEDRSMLALQALLMHDALTAHQLDSVLPATGEPDVLPALIAAGFVEREAQTFRVRVGAYPDAQRALKSAGYPVGEM